MKIYRQKNTLLMMLVFIASCQSQYKIDDPKSENPNIVDPKENALILEPEAGPTLSGPSSITRNIKQDKKGNIWLASWEGVFKYDGNSFTNITSEVSLSRFFSVLEDSKGNFWFGSIGSGVYYYNGDSFRNFTTKEGLANDSVIDIFEAKNGNIWFATQGGASYYDGKHFHNFTRKEGLPDNDINSILEDKTGKLWFASRGELSTYDGKTFTRFKQDNGQAFMNVRSIIEDKQGHIWLGGQDGLWRYDDKTLTNLTTEFVGYIHEDKKGSLWTSSQAGVGWEVTRYDKNVLFPENITATQIWKNEGMFFGIEDDNKGGIWFGTLNGICHYDGLSVSCLNEKN